MLNFGIGFIVGFVIGVSVAKFVKKMRKRRFENSKKLKRKAFKDRMDNLMK